MSLINKKNIKFVFYFLFIVLLGKISGFLKDLLITYYYGVSDVSDAYFFSMSLSALTYVAIHSAISAIIVPIASHKNSNNPIKTLELSVAFFYFLLLSFFVALFSFFFTPTLVSYFSSININQLDYKLAIEYLKIMAFGYVFSTIIGFYNAIQTTRGITLYTYLVPIANNILFCLGLYLFNNGDGLKAVLILTNFSWIFLCILNFIVSRDMVKIDWRVFKELKQNFKVILNILPAIILFFLEQTGLFVGIYFASQLDIGAISIYSYSSKLNSIILSLVSLYLTTVALPKFAQLSAHKDYQNIQKLCLSYVKTVFFITIPIASFVCLYSIDIVALFFQRGKFTLHDAVGVASIFKLFIFILPFTILRDLFNRVFFTSGNIFKPMCITFLGVLINLALAFLFVKNYQLSGIVIATLLSVFITYLLMMLLIQIQMKIGLLGTSIKLFFSTIARMSMPICITVYFRYEYSLDLFFGAILFTSLYGFVNLFLNLGQLRSMRLINSTR
ncbi:murein biosynthesis integral membrane protein MurJ [Legionella tucsonensis]|uniref:Lipid II flippase MurJ n=1 Tax=Legionella tucsonensis TaxID=40335 RepID=A0A0W0ZT82_9GAMM|nr:lipid II flippase MurJ [Legionella tucsonensis]KTD72248.1 hypothetical protein Ltuc_0095 [Legionella tucsonensis]